MADDRLQLELAMEASDLYLEEIFTDRRVGTIQRLTPVDADGRPDPARPVLYVGQTQLMSRMGALPLSFEIQAANLGEAAAKFGAAAELALQDTMQKLEEMRREQASSIIVPDAGGMGGGGLGGGGMGGLGGGLGGGMGGAGGGRIRMP
jgi:hypothetical protein